MVGCDPLRLCDSLRVCAPSALQVTSMWTRVLLLAAATCGVAQALHAAPSGLRPAPQTTLRASSQVSSPLVQPKQVAAPHASGLRLKGGGEQVLTGFIFSLFKAIVGSGILSLSNSVARWTDNPALILPVVLLSMSFAMVAGHCYSILGEVTLMTGAQSYQEAWAKSISPDSAWLPGLVVLSQTLVACVCYSIIIGDLGYDLLRGLGVGGWFAVRNNLLAAVSASVLLPLCLLRDFALLSYTSMLGVTGVLYTAAFMVMRKLGGAYAPGGQFYAAIPKDSLPTFGSRFEPVKMLILMATLNTAFQAHYDAPKFFDLMSPRTVAQFNKLVFPSFLAAGAVSCVCMVAGFLTFGGNANGLILNSYAAADKLAVFGRAGIGCSIVFGYPLCFNGFRTGLLAFLGKTDASQSTKDIIAVLTLLFTTSIAMILRDLGFIASFAGAIFGSCIIYIFPSLMHIAATRKAVTADQALPKKKQKGLTYGANYKYSQAIVLLGAALAVLGGSVSYLEAFTNVLD